MGVVDFFFSMPMFWVVCLIAAGALIFVAVYYLVSLTDLESDYQNPIDMCRNCNQWVLPEIAAQAALTLLLLVTGNWIEFVLNLPLLAWHVKILMDKQHEFDATQIFADLGKHKKINLIKLGFYMVLFFVFLYRFVLSLVQGAFKRPKSNFV